MVGYGVVDLSIAGTVFSTRIGAEFVAFDVPPLWPATAVCGFVGDIGSPPPHAPQTKTPATAMSQLPGRIIAFPPLAHELGMAVRGGSSPVCSAQGLFWPYFTTVKV